VGLRSFRSSNDVFFIIFEGWSTDRYEGGLNLFYTPNANFGPRWTHALKKGRRRHILTRFLHIWALSCPKPTRNAVFKQFSGQILPNALKIVIFCAKFCMRSAFMVKYGLNKAFSALEFCIESAFMVEYGLNKAQK